MWRELCLALACDGEENRQCPCPQRAHMIDGWESRRWSKSHGTSIQSQALTVLPGGPEVVGKFDLVKEVKDRSWGKWPCLDWGVNQAEVKEKGLCVFVYMCVCVCACTYVLVCVCMCTSMHMYLCEHVHKCDSAERQACLPPSSLQLHILRTKQEIESVIQKTHNLVLQQKRIIRLKLSEKLLVFECFILWKRNWAQH